MPDALKEHVFKHLDRLAAVANLSEEHSQVHGTFYKRD